MKLFPDEHETIDGVARALRRRERTCIDVLEGCLARIDELEPEIKAWVVVDRDGARTQARLLDDELSAGNCRGPLHGIPIGIKDIIDVAGLPTAAGFAPWSGRVAEGDASIVASLRSAGGVILGKTVTTQFAWIDPPPTRNPWNLARTPGGSSSGSAAAVACGMCLGAIGTQTGGSIIRPASFCGVAGMKPTHIGPLDRILPFAPHLDHPGPIARTVLDLGLMCLSFAGAEPGPPVRPISPGEFEEAFSTTFAPATTRPRLARLRGEFSRRAEPAMREAFECALAALTEAGAEVRDVPVPFDFDEVIRNHRTIMAAEAAAGHQARLAEHAGDYQPRIRALVEEGAAIPATDYIRRRDHQESLRHSLMYRGQTFDAFVMPATLGPAPDTSTTGDPVFNSPWSYTGSPALSFPVGLSPEGLPLAIQMVEARPLHEFDLIRTGRWCEDVIRRAYLARRH